MITQCGERTGVTCPQGYNGTGRVGTLGVLAYIVQTLQDPTGDNTDVSRGENLIISSSLRFFVVKSEEEWRIKYNQYTLQGKSLLSL